MKLGKKEKKIISAITFHDYYQFSRIKKTTLLEIMLLIKKIYGFNKNYKNNITKKKINIISLIKIFRGPTLVD